MQVGLLQYSSLFILDIGASESQIRNILMLELSKLTCI